MRYQSTDAERPQSDLSSQLQSSVASGAVLTHALGDEYFQIYGLIARGDRKIRKVYKRIGGEWDKGSFNPPKHFDFAADTVRTLPEYADHLTKLRHRPDRCRIVGQLNKGQRAAGHWRNVTHQKKNYEDAQPVWFEFDIDAYDCREIAADFDIFDTANDTNELERIVEEIIARHFPECFRDCSFLYRLTSSSGIKGRRAPRDQVAFGLSDDPTAMARRPSLHR